MQPFSMQPVLKYRQQLEDMARQSLASSQRRLAELKQVATRIQTEIQKVAQTLEEKSSIGISGDSLQMHRNWLERLQQQLQEAEEHLQHQQDSVNRRRDLLLRASQERRALEKLRDQQDQAYDDWCNQRENNLLDETAILRHNHRQ